ncbi:MAG: type III-B CRISPR module-associated protein Cmr5 [Myxococcales bacterium]|nr:type III-B CRISPR module-associated protein Cmr5 [Myxococcota bacterium]MDW8284368.1 type III-B CRISPR module-associated protein Cmr5 [Myxococcales bacterium]
MTRHQDWARQALQCVQRVRDHADSTFKAEYRTQCMRLPALLQQSGLVQALSFLWSRDEKDEGSAPRRLCHDLASVLKLGSDKGAELLRRAIETDDLMAYLALSRDVIEIAIWFRRFAQSELPAPSTPSDGGQA